MGQPKIQSDKRAFYEKVKEIIAEVWADKKDTANDPKEKISNEKAKTKADAGVKQVNNKTKTTTK
jgi:hypothetical protein